MKNERCYNTKIKIKLIGYVLMSLELYIGHGEPTCCYAYAWSGELENTQQKQSLACFKENEESTERRESQCATSTTYAWSFAQPCFHESVRPSVRLVWIACASLCLFIWSEREIYIETEKKFIYAMRKSSWKRAKVLWMTTIHAAPARLRAKAAKRTNAETNWGMAA